MKSLPERFVWGTATSAYQIEGSWLEGGRGLSIWDAFAHTPGKTLDGATGDVACDHCRRFEEDVALMKEMGVTAYRFSLSWSRLLPQGRGAVNEKGAAFYDALIDRLLDSGIEPWVTLFHWDLPLALQMEEDGLLNPDVAHFFADYADFCFGRFGDRVKRWITLNEPWCSAVLGHGQGYFAPGRISNVEPYVAAHNLLRAHGRIVDCYRRKYADAQKGQIGMSNNCDWREPASEFEEDRQAAQRSLEFFLGWFADPLHFGDYPESMRERVGDRLPAFDSRERDLIKGSSDFFGLNHYTTMLAAAPRERARIQDNVAGNGGISEDQEVMLSDDAAWEKTDMGWNVAPWGCRKLLEWVSARYGRPPIYITENGCALPGEDDRETALNDDRRVEFIDGYLGACAEAVEAGVDLRGYFCWSLMDNFEWAHGYSKRFGLHWVDFATGERLPKKSAKWYAKVIEKASSARGEK